MLSITKQSLTERKFSVNDGSGHVGEITATSDMTLKQTRELSHCKHQSKERGADSKTQESIKAFQVG